MLYFQLPKNAGLPSQICSKCVKQLKLACAFRNEFLGSQEIIENCLSETELFSESTNIFEEAELDKSYLESKKRIQESIEEENSDSSEFDADEVEVAEEPDTMEYYEKLDTDEESKPSYSKTMMKKFDEFSDIRPTKCYLCLNSGQEPLTEFDPENAEDHFKNNHLQIKLTKCEYKINFNFWFLVDFWIVQKILNSVEGTHNITISAN